MNQPTFITRESLLELSSNPGHVKIEDGEAPLAATAKEAIREVIAVLGDDLAKSVKLIVKDRAVGDDDNAVIAAGLLVPHDAPDTKKEDIVNILNKFVGEELKIEIPAEGRALQVGPLVLDAVVKGEQAIERAADRAAAASTRATGMGR